MAVARGGGEPGIADQGHQSQPHRITQGLEHLRQPGRGVLPDRVGDQGPSTLSASTREYKGAGYLPAPRITFTGRSAPR
jgi:hypothetical protein